MNYDAISFGSSDPSSLGLICFSPQLLLNLPGQRILLVGVTGERRVINRDLGTVFEACRSFQTVDQHFEKLHNMFRGLSLPRSDFDSLVNNLTAAGIFLTPSSLLGSGIDTGQSARKPVSPETIRDFCITVADRPSTLSRLLTTLAEADIIDGRARIFIIDDSRLPASIRAYRTIVGEWKECLGQGRVHYVGPESHARIIGQALSAFPEARNEIEFLLGHREEGPPTYGRARNIALLLTASRPMVFFDEDIVLCPRLPEKAPRTGIAVGSSPRQARFFASRDDWADWENVSFSAALDSIKGVFGATLGEIQGRGDRYCDLDFAGCSGSEARSLGPESPVLLAGFGAIGDVGIKQNTWLFSLPEPSRSRLLQSEGFYHKIKRGGDAWLGQEKARLTRDFSILNQALVVDNRFSMPPFFPFFRNEDKLFAESVKYLFPGSMMLESNLAIPHLPEIPRTWDADLSEPLRFGVLGLMTSVLGATAPAGLKGGAGDFQGLGARFLELAARSNSDVEKWIDVYLIQSTLQRLRVWNAELGRSDLEPWRRRDLEILAQANEAEMLKNEPQPLSDLGASVENQPNEIRHLCKVFGSAIQVWPEILEYASESICVD